MFVLFARLSLCNYVTLYMPTLFQIEPMIFLAAEDGSPSPDQRESPECLAELNKLPITVAVVMTHPHIVAQPNLHVHLVNLSKSRLR